MDSHAIVLPELATARPARVRSLDHSERSRFEPTEARVEPQTPEGQALWGHVEQLQRFADRHLNDAPSPEAVSEALPAATIVSEAVRDGMSAGLLPGTGAKEVVTILAEVCERWTRSGADVAAEALALARRVLLQASVHPAPTPDPEDDNRRLLAGRSGPRGAAARGLAQLAAAVSSDDSEVLTAVERLAHDPVVFVRWSAVRLLPSLFPHHPEVVCRVLRERSEHERADPLVQLLASCCWDLHRHDLSIVLEVLDRLVATVPPSNERTSGFAKCMEVLGLLWVATGQPEARALLDAVCYPRHNLDGPVRSMLHELRKRQAFVLTDGAHADEIRGRAFALCEALVRAALAELEGMEPQRGEADVDEGRVARWRCALSVVKSVAGQLYYASGACDERRNAGNREHRGDSSARPQLRFWTESRPVLELLTLAPMPRATHHLVETAEFFVDVDPMGVLLLVHRAVLAGGTAGAYHHEGLAVNALVRLLERYLATHRGTLQDGQCLAAVREMLDVFVAAGWPQVQVLAHRLGEAFR